MRRVCYVRRLEDDRAYTYVVIPPGAVYLLAPVPGGMVKLRRDLLGWAGLGAQVLTPRPCAVQLHTARGTHTLPGMWTDRDSHAFDREVERVCGPALLLARPPAPCPCKQR